MNQGLVATAQITIKSPVAEVWDALVTPERIKLYMFGTEVVSDWKEGATIEWRGVWNGMPYRDRGYILELQPNRTLSYSHFSPLSGLPDTQENYHRVKIELRHHGEYTTVTLTQDNNPTEDARAHSEENWSMMLSSLKRLMEAKT